MTTDTIVTCDDCGQRNRIPTTIAAGKTVICGSCKATLDLDLDDDVDDDEDDA